MERYMLHLTNTGYGPADSRRVVYMARDLAAGAGASVRVARIATGFVELDVSVEADRLDELASLLEPVGPVRDVRHVVEEEVGKERGIDDGIFYFNSERFWESHEAFEGVWKKCLGREKELVQGIILVAVAFAHAQRDQEVIGVGMLGRALEKLGSSPSTYHAIDVDRIRGRAREMQQSGGLTLFEI